MKNVTVVAYPYAVQSGIIQVPDALTDYVDVDFYIQEHWDEIDFYAPDLDYCGTDYELYFDDEM